MKPMALRIRPGLYQTEAAGRLFEIEQIEPKKWSVFEMTPQRRVPLATLRTKQIAYVFVNRVAGVAR